MRFSKLARSLALAALGLALLALVLRVLLRLAALLLPLLFRGAALRLSGALGAGRHVDGWCDGKSRHQRNRAE